jgi:uncharacterized protein with HEPN domain
VRDTFERLRDIQEAIENITQYTDQGRHSFNENELIQIWVIRHLEIIGEAARAIPGDFKDRHPEIPWRRINGMRNVLVHIYFGIDLKIVWAVVERDLPVLKVSVDALLSTGEAES